MKLKLVGTGSIVSSRRSACSVIDNNILIDCGNGLVKTLAEQGIDVNDIETVLITHLHADHILDLPFFVITRAITKAKKTATIYCPKGAEKITKHICNDYIGIGTDIYTQYKKDAKVEFVEIDVLENKEVANGYRIDSYIVEHGDKKPAYGYVVKKDGKAIGFSGDSGYCENIENIVNSSTIAVLEMTRVKDGLQHMGYKNIETFCKKYKKIILTTHMSDEARKYALENPIENLIVPDDGDEFEI